MHRPDAKKNLMMSSLIDLEFLGLQNSYNESTIHAFAPEANPKIFDVDQSRARVSECRSVPIGPLRNR